MSQDTDLGLLLKKINESMARRANVNLMKHDLTFAQMHVLVRLYDTPGRTLCLKALEGCFQLAQSTVAGLASRLEKKGLVAYVPDPADKRVKRIRLTDKGVACCEEGWENICRTRRLLVSRLTEEEQQELHRLLEVVYQSIQEE